ncbi:hypothetical protein ACRQ5Q_15070 [Bradyrhizobium sp. PMVTL-01]|uniref:hypothetical protein n=1 Tax=Bradyrhizobium sp. PMVTL-01 TaxID=3434999 RepID=UPI003F72C6D7
MNRPGGTYRAARRNEARKLRKSSQDGKRLPVISYADVRRINAMALVNRQNLKGSSH